MKVSRDRLSCDGGGGVVWRPSKLECGQTFIRVFVGISLKSTLILGLVNSSHCRTYLPILSKYGRYLR